MHFTGTKKDITMYQLFGQILSMPFLFCTPCHFPFWTYFVGPKSTVRRRLKSLEEEVQKLEEEQQLGHTLCLLIWMMWMLLPCWELADPYAKGSFEDDDFPFPKMGSVGSLEDYTFSLNT